MLAQEHRQHRRFDMHLPVRVRRSAFSPGPVETSTKDISANGVYFSFPQRLNVGSELEWEITLPPELSQGNTVRVRCYGKIVRVERADALGRIGIAAQLQSYKFVKES